MIFYVYHFFLIFYCASFYYFAPRYQMNSSLVQTIARFRMNDDNVRIRLHFSRLLWLLKGTTRQTSHNIPIILPLRDINTNFFFYIDLDYLADFPYSRVNVENELCC